MKLPEGFTSLLDAPTRRSIAEDFDVTAHAGELPDIQGLMLHFEYLVRVAQDNTINGVAYKHNPRVPDTVRSFREQLCANCCFAGNSSCQSIKCIDAERTDRTTGYFTKIEFNKGIES